MNIPLTNTQMPEVSAGEPTESIYFTGVVGSSMATSMKAFMQRMAHEEPGVVSDQNGRPMNTKKFQLEDPVERRIDGITQLSDGMGAGASMAADAACGDSTGWRVNGLLATLGAVVAYERAEGGMALSSWDGASSIVWAKFDVDPLPDLAYMRKHMEDAVAIDQPRPPGFITIHRT